ncbi:hypothetical protein GCM10010279_55410 [Streptomyces mutabilis]|nr:hypothetical protein GCM10010279_55410 [Streptomyces mutabilis]
MDLPSVPVPTKPEHSEPEPTEPIGPTASTGWPAAWVADRPGAREEGAAPPAARPGTEHLTHAPGRPSAERATLRLRDTARTAPAHPDDPPRYAPEWLRLREPADAVARALDPLDPLRIRLTNLPSRADGLVVHDVGCGTGSMGRWLAPLLDAPSTGCCTTVTRTSCTSRPSPPRVRRRTSRVTAETRRGDLARLTPDALAGAGLVPASALLDVLTAEEAGALAAACATAGCPALLTLSVAGRVELTPAHPLDAEITEAFNDHQRRTGMLGPDAVATTAEAFAAHGATVRARGGHPRPLPRRLPVLHGREQGHPLAARGGLLDDVAQDVVAAVAVHHHQGFDTRAAQRVRYVPHHRVPGHRGDADGPRPVRVLVRAADRHRRERVHRVRGGDLAGPRPR